MADMSEAPTWAPKARRYEIFEALGLDPWAHTRPTSGDFIFFHGDMVILDLGGNEVTISFSTLESLSRLFGTKNINIETCSGRPYSDITPGDPAYFKIVIKR